MRYSIILFVILIIFSCKSELKEKVKRINGVSLVASRAPVSPEQAIAVKNINANYAALMPFGFVKELDHPEIIFNKEKQWFGETEAGVAQYAEVLDSIGIKAMLKPQLWIWKGEFTGDLSMRNEEHWKEFETQYRSFILHYAAVAEKLNIPIFCIGTELNNFVSERSEFFEILIKEIREIYHGELTYAENWDVYANVPFWKDLDYIGIDAYFPLSEDKTPSVKVLKEGWEKHKEQMEKLSKSIDKPVLFTEYGYRSMDYAAKAPWEHHRLEAVANHEIQINALSALYDTFWEESWFAGGFLWKWFPEETAGGEKNNRFTVQNKPALKTVTSYYKKTK
ncbi:glycoside hydrolase family 113 [Joostella sp.]|uniref:glycoside hydrolase family 113 n=1 Tax=Joostella sp. TaxID=2231138 RepID=UPI003A8E1F1B